MQYISLERIQKYICNWVRIVKHVNDINTSLRLSKKKKEKLEFFVSQIDHPLWRGCWKVLGPTIKALPEYFNDI